MPEFGEELNKKIHDNLMRLLSSERGSLISRAELIKQYQEKYPHENVEWVQATDHCINLTNKGACWCARSDSAIFEWIERGLYKIR